MTNSVQRLARLGLLLALATVIHTVEAMAPINVLWFRFGFANIVTLATLYLFGFKDALLITVGRVFLGSLASGLFGSPAFLLALSGGVLAVCVMGIARAGNNRMFSEVGVSVSGAVAHNCGQLVAAYLIIVRNEAIFALLPFMLISALGAGVLNGVASRFLIERFRQMNGTGNGM
jgi:heptaprenyl diphosphate synthase